jgi:hypothetical protein
LKQSVIPIIREWASIARRRGFVPDECDRNAAALAAFVSGVHHGLWLAGATDTEWAAFAVWLTGQEIAKGNESPLDAAARVSPSSPLQALGDWLDSFAENR